MKKLVFYALLISNFTSNTSLAEETLIDLNIKANHLNKNYRFILNELFQIKSFKKVKNIFLLFIEKASMLIIDWSWVLDYFF